VFYFIVMEIDHLTVPVGGYDTSRRFYEDALRPLGFEVLLDWPDARRAYLGVAGRPSSIWLAESQTTGTLELALAAASPEDVDAFHAAAVSAGGRTQDEPGVRPEHNREYYAARVLDPDGNSIEAVYRGLVTAGRTSRPLAA
jgi:catechol 2,3-dioxygenase-like lactoylglutathione lyase family enzyme